ncbi:MAG: hypothetical protein J6Y00_05580 [Paludibacteraceae bacterium]|nr:hypothetical protein [Paludibacteraceae bacterium]
MRKLLIILLSVLSLTAFAQQKIALLEPRAGDGSTAISGMEKAMLRGELRKAIVNQPGYEAFTRADIDQLMKEQDFQRTGNVSEADIHKMGEMSGADFVCISTLNKSDNEFYLEAYLINVETGAISNPASQYGELVNGKLANMLPVCEDLARELLGFETSQSVQQEQQYEEQEELEEGAKAYNVYAFGIYGVVGYFYKPEYDGTTVEYRVIYKSQYDVPEFEYLGTTPFAFVSQKAYNNPLLNAFRPFMIQQQLIIPDARNVAKIEFRLSKLGYDTVIVKPVHDFIIGGGPVLMIPMNKLK